MYAEILTIINSVKTTIDIAKAANDLSNHSKLSAALYDVNKKLIEATDVALAGQKKISLLTSKVADLEAELVKIKEFRQNKRYYQLHALPSGMLVYVNKKGIRDLEPIHYLCAHCTDNGNLEKLQPVKIGAMITYVCHGCGSQIR